MIRFVYLLLILILTACSGDKGPPAVPDRAPSLKECGIASYYHPSLAGNLTANGEIYRPRKISAAHKSLPFDTEVHVQRLDTGERLKVRINDRGPFVDGRIIDLSGAAARKLGLTGEDGVAPVCILVR